ncbi:MAG: MoaD family protein [Spirochaetota bacterium]
MVTVKFYTLLRLLLKIDKIEIDIEENENIGSMLKKIQNKIETPFISKLLDDNDKLKTGTIILLNGKNIYHLDKLDTKINNGDVIELFPPGGGG